MKPQNFQRLFSLFIVAGIAIILLISVFAGFIIDWLWFSSLSYSAVFWKMLTALSNHQHGKKAATSLSSCGVSTRPDTPSNGGS